MSVAAPRAGLLKQTIVPMMATLSDGLPPDTSAYGTEFKWDGYRALAYWDGRALRFQSRNGLSLTPNFPELQPLASALKGHQVILDGEIIAQNAEGRIDFHALQSRMGLEKKTGVRPLPAVYYVFDVLMWDQPTLDWTYERRRTFLESKLTDGPAWRVPFYSREHPEAMMQSAQANGLEGVVLKRLDSRYRPGQRSGEWLKVKFTQTEEFVIGGWLQGQKRLAKSFGTLLLGYYRNKEEAKVGKLTFAGGVGTGFPDEIRRRIEALLLQHASTVNPFHNLPREAKWRRGYFLKQKLVGEVAFSEWTPFDIVRHPAFKGLRFDKKPSDIILKRTGYRP
jgi:bifunctional non-homologous end joining protein LigD